MASMEVLGDAGDREERLIAAGGVFVAVPEAQDVSGELLELGGAHVLECSAGLQQSQVKVGSVTGRLTIVGELALVTGRSVMD